eukprot:SAG31_NODE_11797_length_997_cov_1.448775_1_plen_113_part_10
METAWSASPTCLRYGNARTSLFHNKHRPPSQYISDLIGNVQLLSQFGIECTNNSDEPVEPINLATGQPASQSSEGWDGSPGRAVDGNVNGAYGAGSCTHTNASPSWWQVDLGA